MKKLKCWKKIGQRSNKYGSVTEYGNKDNKDVLDVNSYKEYNFAVVRLYSEKGNNVLKKVKTKQQALKFANKYMKSHDKC